MKIKIHIPGTQESSSFNKQMTTRCENNNPFPNHDICVCCVFLMALLTLLESAPKMGDREREAEREREREKSGGTGERLQKEGRKPKKLTPKKA